MINDFYVHATDAVLLLLRMLRRRERRGRGRGRAGGGFSAFCIDVRWTRFDPSVCQRVLWLAHKRNDAFEDP